MKVFRNQDDGSGPDNPGGGADKEVEIKTEKTGWLSAVKDDIFKDHGEELAKHENINSVLEEHFTLKGKLSENEADKVEKAEDYEFDDAPEGATKSEEFEKSFRDMALEAGISKNSAKAVFAGLQGLEVAGNKAKAEADTKARAETTKAMKTEYGDKYDGVMAKVAKVLELGGFELKEGIEKSELGNSPNLIKALASIGNVISEDSLNRSAGGDKSEDKSAASILYPTMEKK